MKYCRRCNIRFTYSEHSGDYIHQCNSGIAALDEEDVLRLGTWTDYTGSNAPADPRGGEVFRQGIADAGWGMRSSIEGESKEIANRTARGRNRELYRTRQHLEFIDLK